MTFLKFVFVCLLKAYHDFIQVKEHLMFYSKQDIQIMIFLKKIIMAICLKIIRFPGYVFISIFKSKVMLWFQARVSYLKF